MAATSMMIFIRFTLVWWPFAGVVTSKHCSARFSFSEENVELNKLLYLKECIRSSIRSSSESYCQVLALSVGRLLCFENALGNCFRMCHFCTNSSWPLTTLPTWKQNWVNPFCVEPREKKNFSEPKRCKLQKTLETIAYIQYKVSTSYHFLCVEWPK